MYVPVPVVIDAHHRQRAKEVMSVKSEIVRLFAGEGKSRVVIWTEVSENPHWLFRLPYGHSIQLRQNV